MDRDLSHQQPDNRPQQTEVKNGASHADAAHDPGLLMSITQALATRILRRMQHSLVWVPNIGSLSPHLVERFSRQVMQRYPDYAQKYQLDAPQQGGEGQGGWEDLTLAPAGMTAAAPWREENGVVNTITPLAFSRPDAPSPQKPAPPATVLLSPQPVQRRSDVRPMSRVEEIKPSGKRLSEESVATPTEKPVEAKRLALDAANLDAAPATDTHGIEPAPADSGAPLAPDQPRPDTDTSRQAPHFEVPADQPGQTEPQRASLPAIYVPDSVQTKPIETKPRQTAKAPLSAASQPLPRQNPSPRVLRKKDPASRPIEPEKAIDLEQPGRPRVDSLHSAVENAQALPDHTEKSEPGELPRPGQSPQTFFDHEAPDSEPRSVEPMRQAPQNPSSSRQADRPVQRNEQLDPPASGPTAPLKGTARRRPEPSSLPDKSSDGVVASFEGPRSAQPENQTADDVDPASMPERARFEHTLQRAEENPATFAGLVENAADPGEAKPLPAAQTVPESQPTMRPNADPSDRQHAAGAPTVTQPQVEAKPLHRLPRQDESGLLPLAQRQISPDSFQPDDPAMQQATAAPISVGMEKVDSTPVDPVLAQPEAKKLPFAAQRRPIVQKKPQPGSQNAAPESNAEPPALKRRPLPAGQPAPQRARESDAHIEQSDAENNPPDKNENHEATSHRPEWTGAAHPPDNEDVPATTEFSRPAFNSAHSHVDKLPGNQPDGTVQPSKAMLPLEKPVSSRLQRQAEQQRTEQRQNSSPTPRMDVKDSGASVGQLLNPIPFDHRSVEPTEKTGQALPPPLPGAAQAVGIQRRSAFQAKPIVPGSTQPIPEGEVAPTALAETSADFSDRAVISQSPQEADHPGDDAPAPTLNHSEFPAGRPMQRRLDAQAEGSQTAAPIQPRPETTPEIASDTTPSLPSNRVTAITRSDADDSTPLAAAVHATKINAVTDLGASLLRRAAQKEKLPITSREGPLQKQSFTQPTAKAHDQANLSARIIQRRGASSFMPLSSTVIGAPANTSSLAESAEPVLDVDSPVQLRDSWVNLPNASTGAALKPAQGMPLAMRSSRREMMAEPVGSQPQPVQDLHMPDLLLPLAQVQRQSETGAFMSTAPIGNGQPLQRAMIPAEELEREEEADELDLDLLARKVYPAIKRLLRIERERTRGR